MKLSVVNLSSAFFIIEESRRGEKVELSETLWWQCGRQWYAKNKTTEGNEDIRCAKRCICVKKRQHTSRNSHIEKEKKVKVICVKLKLG